MSNEVAPYIAAMMPSNIRDAMDLAHTMGKAKLVPKDLQNSPGDCLLVIEQAIRWRMSPFAVAQEVSVIQGKLMFSGKIVAAAVHSSGVLHGRLAYAYSGAGQDRTITVSGHLRGEQEPRTVAVRLSDAATSNPLWKKQPDQQLAYHGSRVWARRHTPEVMLGVYVPEEMETEPQPAAKPVDDGRTLDHQPEPEQPKAGNGKPKQTPEEWLEKIEGEIAKAGEAGSDALHALRTRKDVQYGLENLRGENRRRLNQALYEAELAMRKAQIAEPTDDEEPTEDEFPGDVIAREEAAANGESFAEADGGTK